MILEMFLGAIFLLAAYFLFVHSIKTSERVTWRFLAQFLAALLLVHFGLCWLIPFYGEAVTDLFHELGLGES